MIIELKDGTLVGEPVSVRQTVDEGTRAEHRWTAYFAGGSPVYLTQDDYDLVVATWGGSTLEIIGGLSAAMVDIVTHVAEHAPEAAPIFAERIMVIATDALTAAGYEPGEIVSFAGDDEEECGTCHHPAHAAPCQARIRVGGLSGDQETLECGCKGG